ncbi:protein STRICTOSIDINE SYNTHASE-LIKE 4-like [Punica granatum]|uniref:Protein STRICTOSIDINE SYNTHASE-LIKE 4-like n=1 Tax=Punica granatum TaxID=22663 RepID=A0A6P8C0I6_PUNGR|nr:protein STRICTOSIDINE SYNTHASE-LIKE 4-like [Punica granatum]
MIGFTGALKRCVSPLLSFVIASLLASALQIFFFSPISDPQPLTLPLPSPASSFLPSNTDLQRVNRVAEGFLKNPEDVCVDKKGTLYTATRDGWIKRLHRGDGSWENWTMINSQTMLGITAAEDGGIIVCDTEEGLLKVDEDGVTTVLLSYVNGSKLSFADDVIEAGDGSLYFSVASTKFGLHNWYMDVLEAKPHGQLLRLDPYRNQTSLVLDNLGFANGVALSKDQDFLIVCETWKFRCLRHWLKGESQGKTETFTENLPGGPDNINLAPDGTFWIALIQPVREGWGFVHTSKAAKHLVATFPQTINVVSALRRKAVVVNVGADGKIIRKLEDPSGKVLSFVTTALEFGGHLYLGSLNSDYVAKLPLTDVA